jgi:hypothetical protein
VFLCKPYFFILPPTQTTHKQKFAFVMWINTGKESHALKTAFIMCFIPTVLICLTPFRTCNVPFALM